MSEFWNMIYFIYQAIVNWYWGGFDSLLSSLVVFVVIVHITDVMCVIVDHRLLGETRVQAVFKSILIFILVGIGNIIDANILPGTPTIRMTVILYYLSVEGLVILENAVYLGLPVPKKLREVLEQMRRNRLNDES